MVRGLEVGAVYKLTKNYFGIQKGIICSVGPEYPNGFMVHFNTVGILITRSLIRFVSHKDFEACFKAC